MGINSMVNEEKRIIDFFKKKLLVILILHLLSANQFSKKINK